MQLPITGVSENELENILSQIIREGDISIVLQPIISLRDGSILGYEALSRGPENSPLRNPDTLFGVASETGKLWELEQLCRTKALEKVYQHDYPYKLFLNVNASVIHDEKFKQGFTKDYLKNYNIDPSCILFEISEKNAITDLDGFRKTIEHYKRQNYEIAIDDAGAGYSGLNLMTDVHPHYIKLDMRLVRDVDKDTYKKSLVKCLYDFCCLTNVALIAEGIETESELRALIEIGVHYGQGYYIQYPNHEILPIETHVLESVHASNAHKNHIYRSVSNYYIGNLCREGVTVSPTDLAGDVFNYFLRNKSMLGVAVLNSDRHVMGIMTRSGIESKLSGQYGYSLFSKRPIENIMDTEPLITEANTSIDIVSKLAMARAQQKIYDMFVVTKDRRYLGVVTVKDLLEKVMEIEVFNSRQLNPLTGLPGNLTIEKNFERFITSEDPHTILYVDLDNFKAYNDTYGFANGDKVIQFVADLLRELVPLNNFIGHIGGDDFVVILDTYDCDELAGTFIRRFNDGIAAFYHDADLKKGYIRTKNRKGEVERFPIMTVSIAGVNTKMRRFRDIQELTEYASALKKMCKLEWRSCYLCG
jgi:diguanylate cyclase (GGDEF)-like protein